MMPAFPVLLTLLTLQAQPARPARPARISRTEIQQLEAQLHACVGVDYAVPECPLQHTFAPGAYARTITIPAGALVVGKIHKHAHLNMLMAGEVSVATEDGPVRMQAPQVFCSKVGTKRVVFAHTETIWTTVHPTDSTSLEEIEEQVIAKNYDELDLFLTKELL